MLSVGSLFAGIGGFDYGLERAGMRVAWQCEADEFCQRVLAKHWPGVPCYPDVRELRGADVEPVDVLCGGFPCQDISIVGRGAGIDGARSGLWGEYARLIGDLRPSYVVVENVSALLTRGLDRILGDLAAIGYDAEWDCVPASAVGAPHRRDRVWIVAYPSRDAAAGVRASAGTERERTRADCEPRGARPMAHTIGAGLEGRRNGTHGARAATGGGAGAHEGRLMDDADSGRYGSSEDALRARRDRPLGSSWWITEPDVGRVAHGVPARVDRLRSLGNALVPQIAEWLGRRILDYEGRAA